VSHPNALRALVIDPDLRALTTAVRTLAHQGFHVAGRITPDDSLDYIRRARPNVVLLGAPFWGEDWASRIRTASPRTVVVPLPAEAVHAA
jgi:hypothetical protein